MCILAPTLSGARSIALTVVCAGQMRTIGSALIGYATDNDNRLPPFAFSDYAGNLPLSGHWGGAGPGGRFGTRGTESVNLWPLIDERAIGVEAVVCPTAETPVRDGEANYFAAGEHFSSYCLRMPYSRDLFAGQADLLNWRDLGLLGIYGAYGGGQDCPGQPIAGAGGAVVGTRGRVPQVRLDRTYREIDPATDEAEMLDIVAAPILSDMFWHQRRVVPVEGGGAAAVGWCHGKKFNVLRGGGSVSLISDDGTILANSNAPGDELPDDGAHGASYAVKVWRHFARRR